MTWNAEQIGPYHLTSVDAAPFRQVLAQLNVPHDKRRSMRAISKATGLSTTTLFQIRNGNTKRIKAATAAQLSFVLPLMCDDDQGVMA